MSEHSPGPWHYQQKSDVYTHIVRADKHRFICQLSHHPEAEANARLIAAAPELLEALKSATFALALIAQADGNESYLEVAHAAIAKAEGR
jgi:hypothetical protein